MWTPPQRIKHSLPAATWPSRAQAAAALLYQPIAIGRRSARQRTWVPAMVPWRATEDGRVTRDVLEWYRRFAQGQPGVIVVEATGIRDVSSGPLLRIGHDRFIPGLRDLVQAVRDASDGQTLVFIQCIDFLTVRRRPVPETFFRRYLALTDRHRAGLAELTDDPQWRAADDDAVRAKLVGLTRAELDDVLSSREIEALEYGYRERVWDTHLPHIHDLPQTLPDLFAAAADRAFAAGFDGVELHYAHAYTMASFLSARNHRADGYGGTRKHRVRLPVEVIRTVRQRVGRDRVVGVRFLGDEVISGGSRLEDAVYYGLAFARAGIDFLSISKGGKFEDAAQPKIGRAVYPYTGQSGYECMPTVYSDERGPFARNVELAAAIKRAVNDAGHAVPVVTSGGICHFHQAEGILQSGAADIIGAARQTLADPDWFLKMRLGRGDEVRRCQFTNYCEALDQNHKQVTCKLWDRIDVEADRVARDRTGRRRLVAPQWSQ
jgi:dimethylglycine catabolism A